MGQAKQRGTKEERVAQAAQRKREELDYAEATKRALARMAAANERQRVRAKKGDVALVGASGHPRRRHTGSTMMAAMLMASLAGLEGVRGKKP